MSEIEILTRELYEAKEAEAKAKSRRVAIEQELEDALNIPEEWEGSKTLDISTFKVTAARKVNAKIDDDALMRIAKENNLSGELSTLFRWKPEIVKRAWDATSDSIKTLFSEAITRTPGKVSFTIKLREAE